MDTRSVRGLTVSLVRMFGPVDNLDVQLEGIDEDSLDKFYGRAIFGTVGSGKHMTMQRVNAHDM